MPKVPAEVFKQMLALAQQDDRRKIDWPNDWRPYEVNNPDDGQTFTNESAWEFVIGLLESRADCKSTPQKTPANSVAYVFRPVLSDGWKLYVKIRFNKNRTMIFGRSFHYDERQISDE
jgi:hypothetical protein